MTEASAKHGSWRLFSWGSHPRKNSTKEEATKGSPLAFLQPNNVHHQDVKAFSKKQTSAKSFSSIFRSSPASPLEPTPDFGEVITSNLTNSMFVSLADPENELGLSIGAKGAESAITLFDDEKILYYPEEDYLVDTTSVRRGTIPYDSKADEDYYNVLCKNKSDLAFTVESMKLPETMKYQRCYETEVILPEPNRLWNIWVESVKEGRIKLQVRWKVYDKETIAKLKENHSFILDYQVNEKGNTLHLWPFGSKQLLPAGKTKRHCALKPIFWIPVDSSGHIWILLCELLVTETFSYSDSISGVTWRNSRGGYFLTIYSRPSMSDQEVQFFLSELALAMELRSTKNMRRTVRNLFSCANTIDDSGRVCFFTV